MYYCKIFFFFERLKKICFSLEDILINFKPSELIIERVFISNNKKSNIELNQVSGAIIFIAISNYLSVFEYNVSKVRKSVFIKGNVSKKYVNYMIRKILNLNFFDLKYDESDALALALAHYYKFNKNKKN